MPSNCLLSCSFPFSSIKVFDICRICQKVVKSTLKGLKRKLASVILSEVIHSPVTHFDTKIWTVTKVQKLIIMLSPVHRRITENVSPLFQIEVGMLQYQESRIIVFALLPGGYFSSSFNGTLKLCKKPHKKSNPKVLLWKPGVTD